MRNKSKNERGMNVNKTEAFLETQSEEYLKECYQELEEWRKDKFFKSDGILSDLREKHGVNISELYLIIREKLNKGKLLTQEQMAQYIEEARESKKGSDEELETTWLDAVPFDKYGNPTGEVNEYVVHRGTYVIADGLTEEEANQLLEFLLNEIGE